MQAVIYSPWQALIRGALARTVDQCRSNDARPPAASNAAQAMHQEKPITANRIENALDRLAVIMHGLGSQGLAAMPIYERLEQELETAKRAEIGQARVQARVQERVRQSAHRKATQSS